MNREPLYDVGSPGYETGSPVFGRTWHPAVAERQTMLHCSFREISQATLEGDFVIEEGVVVMHLLRIGAVKVHGVACRNALSEIRLERIDPHIDQGLELGLIPLASIGIGEVNERHTGLLGNSVRSAH